MYAMAVPVVNDTNAIDVVTFMTVASVVRASVLHMVVAHIRSVHVHLRPLTATRW